MLTYQLKKSPGVPLYEALYRCIRSDILSGRLAAGYRLPSKRALARNLEVSKITVETAYSQLLAEGYIRSQEKVGYFVEPVARQTPAAQPPLQPSHRAEPVTADLTGGGSGHFPFSVWSRLQREVMLDYGQTLLQPLPNRGIPELRQAIAGHLAAFRGLAVDPENILVGAGTDFLCNLLIQLLGREKTWAVEEPGYGKLRKIYAAGGVRCISAPMDSRGVRPDRLAGAQVLHFSPAHHFPTGLVTPLDRRRELLRWAGQEHWIIEDDFDSEFRMDAHPQPTMASLDHHGRVIYMNTFSKSLAPSIRISYLVLPRELMETFQRKLGFYSCTVPSFEQYTLARFLAGGHFEKHINRMRKFYHSRRDALVRCCGEKPWCAVREQDAGLHFLLRVTTALPDRELTGRLGAAGVRVRALSEYYHGAPADPGVLVINYSGLKEEDFRQALAILEEILSESTI